MRSKRLITTAFAALLIPAGSAVAKTESAHFEHTFDARPGDAVLIDVSFHTVEVTARPGSTVDVTVDLEVRASASRARRLIEELEPVFEERGGKILIRSTRRGSIQFGFFSTSTRGRVVVAVPPDVNVTVDSSSGRCELRGDFGSARLACDTSSGSVEIKGAAEVISADTSSGSVRVDLARPADRFLADTSSGSVKLYGGAREVSVDTSSGGVDVRGLRGDAVFDTSSGSVTAQWDAIAPRARVEADTSSGSVRLYFPSGTDLRGVVDTSSGAIHSDFPGQSSDRGHHLKLSGDRGAVYVTVDTTSGGVRLIAD